MSQSMNVQDIKISEIKSIENSRVIIKNLEGIMKDIQQNGLSNPISVMQTKSGEFIIMSGNRRLAACKKLLWKTIPASIRPYSELQLVDLLVHNLAENLHREDISPEEMGRICDRLRKLGLNDTEISIKLSIPKARVTAAMGMYHQLPDKYRSKVSYMANKKAGDGNIPASVAMKILSAKRQYGLSDAATDRLLAATKMEELTVNQLGMINMFLSHGLSVEQSLKKIKLYTMTRTDIIVENEEVDRLLKKYKMDSQIMLISAMVYGEIPPLKKPDFVNLKQIPAKE